jgi:hypothetical protein
MSAVFPIGSQGRSLMIGLGQPSPVTSKTLAVVRPREMLDHSRGRLLLVSQCEESHIGIAKSGVFLPLGEPVDAGAYSTQGTLNHAAM